MILFLTYEKVKFFPVSSHAQQVDTPQPPPLKAPPASPEERVQLKDDIRFTTSSEPHEGQRVFSPELPSLRTENISLHLLQMYS
jgi:hypothetical protein